MRIDLLQLDAWDRECEQYRSLLEFGQDSTQTIQVYRGYAQALLETALGIAKIFSHKKTIAIVENGGPIFETISQVFSSDGYDVISLKSPDLENPGPWFEPCKDELLFVLHGEDDPVTGECFDHSALIAFFKDKRIFRIHVSHASFRRRPLEISLPFQAQVLSLSVERALLIGGSRCKIRPVFTPQMLWMGVGSTQAAEDLRSWSDAEQAEFRSRVVEFESKLPAPFRCYFDPSQMNRVYDRAVLFANDLDGLAVVSEFTNESDIPLNQTATFSPCLWGSERLVEWRRKKGDADEKIRGLIALAVDSLSPETRVFLQKTAQRLHAIQNGPENS